MIKYQYKQFTEQDEVMCEDKMNELGCEGWELIFHISFKSESLGVMLNYIFRRESNK
jgi:hypothetical protein